MHTVTSIDARPPRSAPTQARVERTARTRWHYTTGQTFMSIVADGFIKAATACGGLVRFAVAPETAPHDWRALKDLSGMAVREAQHLYREGINQGARPGDWWGTFEPVPRSKWTAVQVYESGEWVGVPLDE